MIKKKTRNSKAEALLQIFILIVGLVAISYAIGSSVGVVSAADEPKAGDETPAGDECKSLEKRCRPGTSIIENCINGRWKSFIDCSPNLCSNGDCKKSGLPSFDDLKDLAIKEGVYKVKSEIVDELKGVITKKPSATIPVEDEQGINMPKDMSEEELEEIEGWMTDTESWKEDEPGVEGDKPEKGIKAILEKIAGSFILKTALIAGLIYGSMKLIGWGLTELGHENWGDAISKAGPAAALAYTAGEIIMTVGAEGGLLASIGPISTLAAIPGLGWIAAGIAVIVTLLTWRTESVQVVTYECKVWQPITGGDLCNECNKGIFPCTEYRCKSLGAACELINKGEIEQMCISTKDDGKYPIITAWDDALISSDYKYVPADVVAPRDKGVYVQHTETDKGCIPAFTDFSFGISLNEAAYCKYSTTREANFSDMKYDLSGGLGHYNHSIYLPGMPSASALEAEDIPLRNGEEFDLYVRCEDYHGHSNIANFVFKFCIDEGPDYTNPSIKAVSPLNGAPIAHNQESVEAIFYINELAECRWSHLNKDYDNMENDMSCATSVLEMNAYSLYPCTANLTGLQNNVENKFYVRCKDQPYLAGTEEESNRNANPTSCIFAEDPAKCEYILIGTEPLILDWVTPNNTLVKGPTSSVKVKIEAETSAGFKDGFSTCYLSETGNDGSYGKFYNTNSFEHSQDLWLTEGEYKYYIKCIDLGGNADTAMINFDVETDTEAPIISRIYHKDGYLKIITDEEAKCVYSASNIGCNYNFDEGIIMMSTDNLEHSISWNSDADFYIKCGEIREGGIRPIQSDCSLTVRPFDIY